MTEITIYSAATGLISRRLTVDVGWDALPGIVAANLEPGEAWAEGSYDDETTRFRAGVPTALPERPGTWAVFDATTWAWIDPRTAGDLAAEAAAALDAARAAATAQVLAWIAGAAVPLTGGVPIEEMLSWTAKEAAAEAVLAGTATAGQTTMIQAEATLTGEAVPALCEIILAKAAAYNAAVGIIAGLRRAAEAQLAACTVPEDCPAVAAACIAAAAAVLA